MTTITEYFEHLSVELEGIPASNVINYDETNLCDDPGRKKIIVKRGCKYPERITNHSKSSTSIMFAASGSGVLLPCYIVYKAQNMYYIWTLGLLEDHLVPGTIGVSRDGSTVTVSKTGFIQLPYHI